MSSARLLGTAELSTGRALTGSVDYGDESQRAKRRHAALRADIVLTTGEIRE